jgi:ribosomal protein L22
VAKAADKNKEASKTPAKASKASTEAPQAPEAPMVRAKARYVRVAPRKARLIADQIRGMPVDEARTLLAFSSRGAARDLANLLDSAAANAEANHELVADDLKIADVRVDEGPTLKRWRARARGRATPIHKRTSHLSVALTPTTDA